MDVPAIDLAWALLREIQPYPYPNRTPNEDPYTLLSALLTHALTPSAEDIIATALHPVEDLYVNMEKLTDYYTNSLLVVSIISLWF